MNKDIAEKILDCRFPLDENYKGKIIEVDFDLVLNLIETEKRAYAVQELEKIKDKLLTQDVIGRSLGQVVIDSVDYIDEAIARLNE